MTDKVIDETELVRDDFVKCVYQSNLKTQEAFKTQAKVIAGLYERVSYLEHQLTNNSKIKSVQTTVEKSTIESHGDNIDQDDSDVELIPDILQDEVDVLVDICVDPDEQQEIREGNSYTREQTEVSETTHTSKENEIHRKTDSLLEKVAKLETSTSKSTISSCSLPVLCSQQKEVPNKTESSAEARNESFIPQRESDNTIESNETRNTVVKCQNQSLQHVHEQCNNLLVNVSEHEEMEKTRAMVNSQSSVAPHETSLQHDVNVNTLTSHSDELLVNLSEHEGIKETHATGNFYGNSVVQREEHVSVSNTETKQHEVHEVVQVRNRVFVERRSEDSNSISKFHHSVVDCNQNSIKNVHGIWFGPGTTVITENHDEGDTSPSMFGNFAEDFQKHLKLSIQPMIDARSTKGLK